MEAFLIKKICDSDLKELICKKNNMQNGIKQHDSNTDCLMIKDLFNTDEGKISTKYLSSFILLIA